VDLATLTRQYAPDPGVRVRYSKPLAKRSSLPGRLFSLNASLSGNNGLSCHFEFKLNSADEEDAEFPGRDSERLNEFTFNIQHIFQRSGH
jgi:hypothetical protein